MTEFRTCRTTIAAHPTPVSRPAQPARKKLPAHAPENTVISRRSPLLFIENQKFAKIAASERIKNPLPTNPEPLRIFLPAPSPHPFRKPALHAKVLSEPPTMCGIAGFFSADRVVNRDLLRSMTDRIAHRGPDDSGFFCDDFVALGFRRLSIIDLAHGHQPMPNEDGRLQILYNGEIFNHADLRPALEAAGHLYRTRCDTETIVHAFEQYGEDCVTRFRGMFAFAIWDNSPARSSAPATA